MSQLDESSDAVLILAPVERDASLIEDVLERAAIPADICASLSELAARADESASALIIAEEGLVAEELPPLLNALGQQPAWSDLPVLILTSQGGSKRMGLQAVDIFGPTGNVTLLERPLHDVNLLGAVKVALRARQRQREVHDLIEQRETVLASISDAFSALDFEFRYTYVNDRAAELAGLPKTEMVGRSVWEIFPEMIGTEFYEIAQKAMRERTAVAGEFFHQRQGRWLETRVYPTKSGIVIFRADITVRRQQEELARERDLKLQESQDLLRLATEAANIGTFDFYPKTGEVRWSERCKQLYGVSTEKEVTYETYLKGVHPDDRHIVNDTTQSVLQPGSSGLYDIEYRTIGIEDGKERWVSEKGRAILDENGEPERFIGTVLDVTERKNAEIQLTAAKQQAESANRAKDQFLAMLSHELRTPLTPVLMTIASLRRQPEVSEELRYDLEVLQRNVELEALLIDDLLDLTRIAHGKLQLHSDAVDLHTSLEHALSISASELEQKKLQVVRRFEAAEHHAWADAARLQQVFWNLVKNAVKFTPEGGRLEVRTRNNEAHQVMIEIADSGIGIDPELMPRIFDAFEQGGRSVTSQYGGLGLGLAISKRVIDLHGGTISVTSAGRGQGSTFTITLTAMQTSLLDGPVFLPNETKSLSGLAVLLVEDHLDSARVLRRVLEKAGFVVEHADSVEKAKLLAARQKFDLVLSDLGLPDGNGCDLMRHLTSTSGLRGIALSGFGTDDDRAASKAAGFFEHLTKPVDWPQLRSAIERLLATKDEPILAETVAP